MVIGIPDIEHHAPAAQSKEQVLEAKKARFREVNNTLVMGTHSRDDDAALISERDRLKTEIDGLEEDGVYYLK